MSDVSGDESSSVGVFSTDSSDEWSCSSHSFDEHAFVDDEENWTVQPYQFELRGAEPKARLPYVTSRNCTDLSAALIDTF